MNNSKSIINHAVAKANTMFNPSYNQHTEELSGEPSDRSNYDYAGSEPSNQVEHELQMELNK